MCIRDRLPTAQGILAAEQLSESADLDPGFLREVNAIVESPDLAFVMKRLGLQPIHHQNLADTWIMHTISGRSMARLAEAGRV